MRRTRRDQIHRPRLPAKARQEQILAAAVGLFARQGYARTTTKEIAREAGVSEGTIYRYFDSKQDLLFAFVESVGVQTLGPVLQGEAEAGAAEVVRAFFLDRLALAERNLPLMKVVVGEALFDPALARAFAAKVVKPVSEMLEGFLTASMRAGRLREVDPRLAALALAGLFVSFGVLWPALLPAERRAYSPEQLAEMLTGLYLEGLSAGSCREEVVR